MCVRCIASGLNGYSLTALVIRRVLVSNLEESWVSKDGYVFWAFTPAWWLYGRHGCLLVRFRWKLRYVPAILRQHFLKD
jgi:hypothetical protein